jgi:hypothetical protein
VGQAPKSVPRHSSHVEMCVCFPLAGQKNWTDLAIWTHEFSDGGGPYIAAKKNPGGVLCQRRSRDPSGNGIWGCEGCVWTWAENKKSPTMCSANVAPRPRRKWDLGPRGLRLDAGESVESPTMCSANVQVLVRRILAAHKESGGCRVPSRARLRNPWIQHIKSSVYVSPHQANMSSECSDSSRLGSGTSSGRGGCTPDAGIVRKQTSLSCESSSGGCEHGFQQTQ